MLENGKMMPSVDVWLREAKADASAPACGMYLTHNGVVRATPKSEARGVKTDGVAPGHKVSGMVFGYDADKVRSAIEATRAMPGIGYVRVWLASGGLAMVKEIAQFHGGSAQVESRLGQGSTFTVFLPE